MALEVQAQCLQIEPDPVLADMLRAMHLIVNELSAPFEPEGGAYAAAALGHGHAHDTAHHSAHDHADPVHSHDHRHPHP